MNNINLQYARHIHSILGSDEMDSRNCATYTNTRLPGIVIDRTPLVTVRSTAYRKALLEMEWFLSGERRCPDALLDWWEGQLNDDDEYVGGYSEQLRYSGVDCSFDQVLAIQNSLKTNPNSRRLLMTTWNPSDMFNITKLNDNAKTPTCCHSVIVQFFVRNGTLHMTSYQRSADMLLGVPHNWIQSWAMLMWFAHHANLKVGTMYWLFGDAHIYNEPSHIEAAFNILGTVYDHVDKITNFELVYKPTSETFLANDFYIEGTVPSSPVKIRPRLL